MRMFLGALLILCLVQTPYARAQSQGSPDKSLAARTEYIPIETLTLSDQQFLTGDKGGKPVTVAGQLRLAQGSRQSPLVILVHGSGGVATNNEMWERWFNQMGVSTFALDGFTGRGLTSLQADQSQLGRLNMIIDVYRSLAVLAKHAGIDPKRIALMGFSRGGQITLYASVRRFQKLWNDSGIEIAAYIPVYAQCYEGYIDDSDISGPIRLFHGVPDDYNPIAPCRSYVERLRKAGKDVQLTEYADTWHVFDSPTNPLNPDGPPRGADCTQLRHQGRSAWSRYQRDERRVVYLAGSLRRERRSRSGKSRGIESNSGCRKGAPHYGVQAGVEDRPRSPTMTWHVSQRPLRGRG